MKQDKLAKKRKYWPFLGLIFAILSPLLLVNFVTFIGAQQQSYFSWAAFWMAVNLIFFFILWKCAYKKPGTKLLTTYLWIAPFIWLSVLLQLCGVSLDGKELCVYGLCFGLDIYTESFNSYETSYVKQAPWTIKTAMCTVAYAALFLSFYYSSLCLRRQNKPLKLR